MDIRPVRTSEDHAAALREIDRLWGAQPDTPDGDKLEVLVTLVAAYEDAHFPMPEADPVDLIKFAIEDMGRSESDLARLLGSRSRAATILSRQTPLTLPMIRAISAEWKLPVEALVKPYQLQREPA